jgi:GDSL-like Lipase/Acylhydrolase family
MRISATLVALGLMLVGCAPATPVLYQPPAPKSGEFDARSVGNIDVLTLPVIPVIEEDTRTQVQAAFALGKRRGNRDTVFSRLGDCMTENPHFLTDFGDGNYDLGAYASLQPLVERFRGAPQRAVTGKTWDKNAFNTPGLSAAGGFNIAAPLDPIWADPAWCQNSETPIACEFRVAKPAYAIIMFGTNDIPVTEPDAYNFYLRGIVAQTLEAGIVPILSTFPERPEDPAKTRLLNQIAIAVARDYRVPIMNLYRALEDLPNRGVDPNDTIHLSAPADGRTDVFTEANLSYGFTRRNLLVLQTLDAVVRAVEGEAR